MDNKVNLGSKLALYSTPVTVTTGMAIPHRNE